MRMLALTAIAALVATSGAIAQTDTAPAPIPTATTHSTTVHTRTVTHHDGKRHPKVTKVVHRSTVATPTGAATKTTSSTSTSTPQ